MSADMSLDDDFFRSSQANDEEMLDASDQKLDDEGNNDFDGMEEDEEDNEVDNDNDDDEEDDGGAEEDEQDEQDEQDDEDEEEEDGEAEEADDGEGDGDEDEDEDADADDDDDGNDEGNDDGDEDGDEENGDGAEEENGHAEVNGKQYDKSESVDVDGKNEMHNGEVEGEYDQRQQRSKDSEDLTANQDDENEQEEEGAKEKTEESWEAVRGKLIAKAKAATDLDIVPSVAIPYSSECHALAFSEGPKWILTGGEDGFIRKYDFIASIEGKSPLTMAQKHNLVDSITKAGVISSYWENEQPLSKEDHLKYNSKLKASDFDSGNALYEPKASPVYALGVERNGFWCLSGLSSGGISLYTMRHNEGAIHHYFNHGSRKQTHSVDNGHNDAVSVIKLNSYQNSFLSGSWDKTIRQWDLNTGKCVQYFAGSSGQVSNIEYRPLGLSDLSISFDENDESNAEPKQENSDIDSLFGDSDNEKEVKAGEDSQKKREAQDTSNRESQIGEVSSKLTDKKITNDSVFMSSSIDGAINIWDARASSSPNYPVLRIGLSEETPPWCMSSTWSNCGEYIYAGRRNSTVEEFSLKMPHRRSKTGHNRDTMVPNVLKLLQFPKISGPVSALSTLPNNDFLLCGSNDNIRLYNLKLYNDLSNTSSTSTKKQATPFLIVPGHHGGILSTLHVDDTGRFMISASGNRGWGHSTFTDAVLIYEIDFENID